MKVIRLFILTVALLGLCCCRTVLKKSTEQVQESEPLPVVDPFAPVTSGTAKYWEKRNAEDAAADEKDRAEQKRRGS